MALAGMWPWAVVAAAGALHGLNPAAGWAFGACGGLRMLFPIAAGQAGSVAFVAAAVPVALRLGMQFNPVWAQCVAGAWLLAIAAAHFRRRANGTGAAPRSRSALVLWSFIVGIAHGAGWMLVPAFVSLCTGDAAVRQITSSGSVAFALMAVGVHLAAMLGTTAVMAFAARRAMDSVLPGWARPLVFRQRAPTAP